ncbi:hypothetical protein [Methanobrevibacter sp.]
MNEFNREIFNRLKLYFENYRTDFPNSFDGIRFIPIVGNFKKMFDDDNSLAALVAMYLSNYLTKNELNKEIKSIKTPQPDDYIIRALIKQVDVNLKNNPKITSTINDIVDFGFQDSYNHIDKLNKCPPIKPVGVSNVYFDDVSPKLQLAINKHWGDYNGTLNDDFINNLRNNVYPELESNKVFLKAITENIQNPTSFYLRVKDDNELMNYIKTLPKKMQDEYMNVYNQGYLQYNKKQNLLGSVKSETTADLNYMDHMSSEDKNNLDLIKRSYNIGKQALHDKSDLTPSELLERCKEIIENEQITVDSNTTDQTSPFRKYVYGGLGIGALGLTSYGLYKYYKLLQQRKQLEEETKQRELEHQRQLELERNKKRKIVINNTVPTYRPREDTFKSIWN